MTPYGPGAARHYAAYRPPLHGPLLSGAFGSARFGLGLDLGCGTGQSTRALAPFCERVIGVDSSAEMIAAAPKEPGIDYLTGSALRVPLVAGSVDVITAAGLLPYLDLAGFAQELRRLSRAQTQVLIYDFKVDLSSALQHLGLPLQVDQKAYAHEASLSRLPGFVRLSQNTQRRALPLTPMQLTHLILSSEARLAAASEKYPEACVDAAVEKRIAEWCERPTLMVTTWSALHQPM